MAGLSEGGKVRKSTKGRGEKKEIDAEVARAQIENYLSQPSTPSTETKQEKRQLQGVVINGKTYTCATCKSGHRVGVCKHARERPMKATHPPGRPAAGAPKKVVCDCPKECTCSKKDCKCPRTCACTQTMYMLVYIHGPGEEGMENPTPEEEKGTWQLGESVVTDLKGNILSEEEAKERLEQKEAQKAASAANNRSGSSSTLDQTQPYKAQPTATGGCCTHKQVVQSEINRVAEHGAVEALYESSQSLMPPPRVNRAMRHGCNCGLACRCAFCPEHSGNRTSRDMIRQQVSHVTQHQNFQQDFGQNSTLTTLNTNIPQSMSCMGGQPQFALSRHPANAGLTSFGQDFPAVGGSGDYILSYPLHRQYHPVTPMVAAPNTMISPLVPTMQVSHPMLTTPTSIFGASNTMIMSPMGTTIEDSNAMLGTQSVMPGMPEPNPLIAVDPFTSHQSGAHYDNWAIGQPIVAIGGPDGWQQQNIFDEPQPFQQLAMPEFDTPMPEFDTPMPEFETPLPEFDTPMGDLWMYQEA